GAGVHYVTIINKTQGAGAMDAAVTIVPPGPVLQGAEVMTLSGGEPGDATGASATLGGAAITGDTPWDGKWSALPPDPRAGITPRHGQDQTRSWIPPPRACPARARPWRALGRVRLSAGSGGAPTFPSRRSAERRHRRRPGTAGPPPWPTP